jgi:hypothetical protein
MKKKSTYFTIILVFCTLALFSQKKDSLHVKLNHYSFTVATGWTHYIDNLENGDQKLKQDFMGFAFKFFWQPEYLISLGLETGYYKLFRATEQISVDTTAKVDRSVVPLLLLVRMRIIENFYLGAGMGIAIITNKTTGVGPEIVTKTNSLSNFELCGSYIYPLNKRWRVGGEAKAYHFGSLNDWMYSLQVLCAIRF